MKMDPVRRNADAATQLLRALTRSAMQADCEGETLSLAEHPWASATFVGTRHRLRHTARAGAVRDRWVASLPHAAFTLNGHLVADIAVTAQTDDAVTIVALTLIAD